MKNRLFLLSALVLMVMASGCKKEDKEISFTMNFSKSSLSINEGETVNLNKYLVFEPAEADSVTITWSSSDETVAYVSKSGRVTGGFEGKGTVKASSHGKEASIEINVTAVPIESYTLASTVSDVYMNDEVELPITNVEPAGAGLSKLTWTSSNPDCLPYYSVEGKCWMVKPTAYGELTLTSSYTGLADQTCTIDVILNRIKKVEVTPASPALLFNSTVELKAEVTKENPSKELSYPENLVWSSSNESVASVDDKGVVTSYEKEGTAQITCWHKIAGPGDKNAFDKIQVTVTKEDPLTDFSLDKTSMTLEVNASGVINVTSWTPDTSSPSQIAWKCDKDDMLTFSPNGSKCTVTAKNKGGKCNVIASVNDVQKQVEVTVKPVSISSVSITTESGIMFADDVSKYKLKYTISPANATVNSVTAYMSDSEIYDKDYTINIDAANKEVTVTVKSSIGEKKFLRPKLYINAFDGEAFKTAYTTVYIVSTDIYDKIASEESKNVYGVYGMTNYIYPATFMSSLPEKLESKLIITNITFSHAVIGGAVQIEGGGQYKDPYTYADPMPLRFKLGEVDKEYYTQIAYKNGMIDMNGKVLYSSLKYRRYYNYMTRYKYETVENKETVDYKTSPGSTIELEPQSPYGTERYESVKIRMYYKTNYKDGTEIESNDGLVLCKTISDYDSYKGKTLPYLLGEESWNMPARPIFYVHYNK